MPHKQTEESAGFDNNSDIMYRATGVQEINNTLLMITPPHYIQLYRAEAFGIGYLVGVAPDLVPFHRDFKQLVEPVVLVFIGL